MPAPPPPASPLPPGRAQHPGKTSWASNRVPTFPPAGEGVKPGIFHKHSVVTGDNSSGSWAPWKDGGERERPRPRELAPGHPACPRCSPNLLRPRPPTWCFRPLVKCRFLSSRAEASPRAREHRRQPGDPAPAPALWAHLPSHGPARPTREAVPRPGRPEGRYTDLGGKESDRRARLFTSPGVAPGARLEGVAGSGPAAGASPSRQRTPS